MAAPTDKLVVSYLHPGKVDGPFMRSAVYMLVHDVAHHRRIVDGGGWLEAQASANLSGPRNEMVRRFLDFGKADWLLMLDADMTFEPDLAERLLEFADPDEAPIVGGLCFGFDTHGSIEPTLYGIIGDDVATADAIQYHEWPPDAMFQVAATGAACLLIHRSALERIRDVELPSRSGRRGFNDAFPWFQETEHNGKPVGEDFTFCWRAGACGIPVYVNTAVQLGHMKQRELTVDSYLAQRAAMLAKIEAEQVPEEVPV